jgi:hypothetical protein
MVWIIRNSNGVQWGDENYATKEAAEKELRTFWKGVHGVRLERFSFDHIERSNARIPTPPTQGSET